MEAQHRVRSVIENLNDFDYRSQFHHELSALGWHLGHCLYIENYWLHEVLSADDSLTKGLDQLYIPEKSYKPERGGKLPELKQLISMAVEYQKNNVQLLNNITTNSAKRYLLKDAYLQNFILQHYDQHYESMQMALQQRALKESYSGYRVTSPLRAQQPVENTIHIKQSEQTIGSDHVTSYDNERPSHKKLLHSFSISIRPVSNSEYLAFMQDNNYQNKELWSDEGWQWLLDCAVDKKITAPEHWRQDKNGHWFGIDNNGAFDLRHSKTLYGINYYEACAFAAWCGARLPHEHEWETAQTKQLLENTGTAWEWCQNRFYPYPGFKAFPYDGYSLPWFEQPHYVLKGGSPHTQKNIKRASFRNFFGPDKRHIFAGCRLVYT